MAEFGYFFDAVQLNGEWDRTYEAADFAQLFDAAFTSGVIPGKAGGLVVTGGTNDAGTAPAIIVATGAALINGYMYINTEAKKIDLSPIANTTANRKDRVVIELNTSTRIMTARVLTGSPATNPEAPAITWSDPVYQLAIADITIAPGATTVRAIDDKRGDATLNTRGGFCGVRLKDADLRGLTETWMNSLRAVLNEATGDDQDTAGILLNLRTDLQTQINTKPDFFLLYAPSSVSAVGGSSIQLEAMKGYDAIQVFLRFADNQPFYWTRTAGSAKYSKKQNKWTVTNPDTPEATISWRDHQASVLVPHGTWQTCCVYDAYGHPALRHLYYNKDTGVLTFSAACVGGQYNARVPYEWYENNSSFDTKDFSAKKTNGKTTTKKGVRTTLNEKALCTHFALPVRIYGLKASTNV